MPTIVSPHRRQQPHDLRPGESFEDGVDRAVPYDEAGVLTRNAGLVLRMDDGAEFQVTVVRSR